MPSDEPGHVPSVEEVIAVTDPGEMNRDEHTIVDRFVVMVGNVFAWLFPLLMVAIVTQVVIRKMGHNQAWLDDLQWWLYGVAMMVGFSYAIVTNSHVRVDIFHARFSREKQAKTELFGLGWLALPYLVLMGDLFFNYAYSSWRVGEVSDSPTGMHGIYLLKMGLELLWFLAIAATLSAMWRYLRRLGRPSLAAMLVAGLPAFVFAGQRLSHYLLYWFVRVTRPEINPRRIGREAIMDNTLWMGFALVALLMIASMAVSGRGRRRRETGRGSGRGSGRRHGGEEG